MHRRVQEGRVKSRQEIDLRIAELLEKADRLRRECEGMEELEIDVEIIAGQIRALKWVLE